MNTEKSVVENEPDLEDGTKEGCCYNNDRLDLLFNKLLPILICGFCGIIIIAIPILLVYGMSTQVSISTHMYDTSRITEEQIDDSVGK